MNLSVFAENQRCVTIAGGTSRTTKLLRSLVSVAYAAFGIGDISRRIHSITDPELV